MAVTTRRDREKWRNGLSLDDVLQSIFGEPTAQELRRKSIQCLGVYVVPCDDAPWREDLDGSYRSLGLLQETEAYWRLISITSRIPANHAKKNGAARNLKRAIHRQHLPKHPQICRVIHLHHPELRQMLRQILHLHEPEPALPQPPRH